uniref:PX domain-containing protein n=1 Tax=Plectus sambesii TaxID=2011161 RepID=A0A914WPB1_9BILA
MMSTEEKPPVTTSNPSILDDDDDEDIFGPPKTKKSDATAASATASASMPIATATSDASPIKSNDDLFADAHDEIDLDGDGLQDEPPITPQLRLNESDGSPLHEHRLTPSPPLPVKSESTVPTLDPLITETRPSISPKPAAPSSPASISTTSSPHAAASAPIASARASSKKQEEDDTPEFPEHVLEVAISEYEKRGDGMNAYMVYKVVTKTGPNGIPGYAKKLYEVWRRFSDFLGLHEKLSGKHLHNGLIVPPPPEKSVIGMTKAKMGKGTEEDHGTSEFLERRRCSLERFVRRIALHPVLMMDCDFRDFVTFDAELPKASSTAALSSAGVIRMFRSVGDVFTKIAYHMDENDRWFEEKQNEVDDLDDSLKKLQASVESLVMFRRELAGGTESFCKSMSMLASCEENTALARAFSQLAETQEKVGLLQHDQAEKDFFIFSEMLRDYLCLIAAVKEVFYERVKAWQNWQTAQQNLTKKRELKTRMELSGKTDKLPQAKQEVTDAEKKVEELEEEFGKISKQIRKEMNRFNAQRVKDFKATLLQYLESLALSQQQLVKYWEAFVPEARAIIT